MRRALLGVASVLLLVTGVGVADPAKAPASAPAPNFAKDRGVASRAKKVKDLLADASAKVLTFAKADTRYPAARQAVTDAERAPSQGVRRTKQLEVAPTVSAIRTDAVGKARVNLAELEAKAKAVYPMSRYVSQLGANVGAFTPTLYAPGWGTHECAGPEATGPLAFDVIGSGDSTCVSERAMTAFYALDTSEFPSPSRLEVAVVGSVSTNSTIITFGVGGYSVVEVGLRVMATTQTPLGGPGAWSSGETTCVAWMTGHAAASTNFATESKTEDKALTLKCGVDISSANGLWLFAEIFNRATLITDLGSTASLGTNLKVNSVTFTLSK